MTIVSVSNMIFIGNLPPIDTDETDGDTDNANSLIGTYSSFSDLESVAITNNDVDEDGAILDDEFASPDFVTYTIGGTNYTEVPDATITYFATVTEDDGTIHNVEVVVVQMTNGDVFVGDMMNAGNLDNLTIRSIELTAPSTTDAAGYNTFQNLDNTTVCYSAGTLIDTPDGPQRVETLRRGDQVLTLDAGACDIRWIGSFRVRITPRNAPIEIAAHALGPSSPAQRLRVSPQHRVLVRSRIAERMFGTPEVLVAAKRLVGLPGITQRTDLLTVRYWHILLDDHHLVFANGLWAETLLTGTVARETLHRVVRRPNQRIPNLPQMTSSRFIPDGASQKQLVARHAKNRKPVLSRHSGTGSCRIAQVSDALAKPHDACLMR